MSKLPLKPLTVSTSGSNLNSETASKVTGLTKMDVKEDLKNFKDILEEGDNPVH